MRSKFEASKIFVFNHRVSLKVLTKSDTNFGYFACTLCKKMKPRGIFCSKRPFFNIDSHLHPLTNEFWTKMYGSFRMVRPYLT